MQAGHVLTSGALVESGGNEGEGEVAALLLRVAGWGGRGGGEEGREGQGEGERSRGGRHCSKGRAGEGASFDGVQQLLQAVGDGLAGMDGEGGGAASTGDFDGELNYFNWGCGFVGGRRSAGFRGALSDAGSSWSGCVVCRSGRGRRGRGGGGCG